MKKLLKNKKGFTLLEVLVTVGIVGVLSAIAIPAYKQYKDNANRTAVKLEVSSAHKAYLAYDTANNSFCADLAGAGVATIGTSAIYANASESFAGFSDTTACNLGTGALENNVAAETGGTPKPIGDVGSCELSHGSFTVGVGFIKTGSIAEGYFITDTASGPTASNDGGTCVLNGVSTACTNPHTNKDACNNDAICEWKSPASPTVKLCDA